MATVFRAVREPDGVAVVIKRIRPPLCFDPGYLRLFADEAAVHGALDDDHVVRLLDRGEDAQGPFLVFEHIDGTDLGVLLDAAIAQGTPLDVEFVLAVALRLVGALAFVHEASRDGRSLDVVHRDVSPGNVLLGDDGTVKLADFGVAASRLKTEQTVAGEVKGKFAYMAPEQTRGEPATPQTDLFAVGVVLWECLQNKRLWDGATDADVVRLVREEAAPPLDAARVGDTLATLVASLLQKASTDRPASARSVAATLREVALDRGLDEGLGRIVARVVRQAPRRTLGAVAPDARRRTQRFVGSPAPAAPRRRRWRGVIVAMTALSLGGGALWWTSPPPETVLPLPDVMGDRPVPPRSTTTAGAPPTTPATTAPDDVGIAAPGKLAGSPDTTNTAGSPGTSSPRAPPSLPLAATPRKTSGAKASLPRPGGADPSASRPVDNATANGFGRLSVASEPWARVSVDGVVVAEETPLVAFTLPAGRHTVQLTNPVVGASRTLVVVVRPDAHERLFVDLTR
jgi:serine/threonine-protein kinase